MADRHFQVFPGTAGFYASTPDTNLLDADTAHLHQSVGTWSEAAGATGPPAQSADLTPQVGDFHLAAVADAVSTLQVYTATGTDGVPVSASTQYTASASFAIDTAARAYRLRILWYDAGGTLITSSTGSTIPFSAVDTWETASLTATSPVGAAFATLYVWMGDVVLTAASGTLYLDAACLVAGSDASFVPSLRIVGDLDLRAKLAANDWTPTAITHLIDEYKAANNSWTWQVRSDGKFYLFINGGSLTQHTSTVAHSITDGDTAEVRATFAASDVVKFYVDDVQLGSNVATTQAHIQRANTNPLAMTVAADGDGSNPLAGNLYWAEVRDGIDGPRVARWDAADVYEEATS